MDKNLEDDWLCRLNHLQHLVLRNICEGHPGASGLNQQPHATIKLSLKDEIACAGDTLTILKSKGASFFDAHHTKVEVHEDELQGTPLSAWIDHTCPRVTVEMDEVTRSWFTHVVTAAERFDGFIGEILHGTTA